MDGQDAVVCYECVGDEYLKNSSKVKARRSNVSTV